MSGVNRMYLSCLFANRLISMIIRGVRIKNAHGVQCLNNPDSWKYFFMSS
jgi:hypothetical protein